MFVSYVCACLVVGRRRRRGGQCIEWAGYWLAGWMLMMARPTWKLANRTEQHHPIIIVPFIHSVQFFCVPNAATSIVTPPGWLAHKNMYRARVNPIKSIWLPIMFTSIDRDRFQKRMGRAIELRLTVRCVCDRNAQISAQSHPNRS